MDKFNKPIVKDNERSKLYAKQRKIAKYWMTQRVSIDTQESDDSSKKKDDSPPKIQIIDEKSLNDNTFILGR